MLELLREKGYKKASLSVQKENYALRMYQRVGFQIIRETAQEYIMEYSMGYVMEELLAYALLLYEDILPEDSYQKRLDALFLEHPDDEMLLELEWEPDIEKSVVYIRTHVDYRMFCHVEFGRVLMKILKEYYENCSDIRMFADKMYSLWESLPGNIQEKQPFFTLCYADDPLSWGDEEQTRNIYENMLNYYTDETEVH